MPETRSYLEWEPFLTPEEIFVDYLGLSNLKVVGTTLYWLELRPAEKGRIVLVRHDGIDKQTDITPKDYYIRTRVHEYGGPAYIINNKFLYFSNFLDQRIYKQRLEVFHLIPHIFQLLR